MMTIEAIAPVGKPVRQKSVTKKVVDTKSLINYRLMIFFRFILAIFGGYFFSAITAMLIGAFFISEPNKANAVLMGTMLAFVLHCAVFIWVFMVKSTLKAWLGVLVPTVIFYVVYLLMKGG